MLAYWEYLRASVTEMALQYRDALARSEEGTYAVNYMHVAGNIAFGFAVWNHHTYNVHVTDVYACYTSKKFWRIYMYAEADHQTAKFNTL